MKKAIYAFYTGMCVMGVWCFISFILLKSVSPEIYFTGGCILFIIGVFFGCIDYDKRQRKKAEEEKHQAEQDLTNKLMREYLEKKLQEEKEKK